MIQYFDKMDLTVLIAVIGLVIALLVGIFNGMNELTMSIGSGLLGYIGGNAGPAIHNAVTKKTSSSGVDDKKDNSNEIIKETVSKETKSYIDKVLPTIIEQKVIKK